MTNEELINKIRGLLKVAKISQEEKDEILAKIETIDAGRLGKLHDNLLQQIMIDIYFEFLDEVDNDERLLDDEDINEFVQKLKEKLEKVESNLLSETEVEQIRQNLKSIQQNAQQSVVEPTANPSITSTSSIPPQTSS
ncbi:hypothetical protein HYW54_02400 [Candidatus Gottesmanbacteria bacterium]|nr:hypothetical protein [Candidatus Gottesmanbacteria bacterium]